MKTSNLLVKKELGTRRHRLDNCILRNPLYNILEAWTGGVLCTNGTYVRYLDQERRERKQVVELPSVWPELYTPYRTEKQRQSPFI